MEEQNLTPQNSEKLEDIKSKFPEFFELSAVVDMAFSKTLKDNKPYVTTPDSYEDFRKSTIEEAGRVNPALVKLLEQLKLGRAIPINY